MERAAVRSQQGDDDVQDEDTEDEARETEERASQAEPLGRVERFRADDAQPEHPLPQRRAFVAPGIDEVGSGDQSRHREEHDRFRSPHGIGKEDNDHVDAEARHDGERRDDGRVDEGDAQPQGNRRARGRPSFGCPVCRV